MDNKFKTQKRYDIERKNEITFAMEDYIEMIYRKRLKQNLRIGEIANFLNVNSSSVSKMISKLKKLELVNYEKYKMVSLTQKGLDLGKYLLKRHEVLQRLFLIINKNKVNLEQIEQIEHFFDKETILNIEEFLKEYKK